MNSFFSALSQVSGAAWSLVGGKAKVCDGSVSRHRKYTRTHDAYTLGSPPVASLETMTGDHYLPACMHACNPPFPPPPAPPRPAFSSSPRPVLNIIPAATRTCNLWDAEAHMRRLSQHGNDRSCTVS